MRDVNTGIVVGSDVEMDGGTGNVIVKGKDAQLSNEIIAHQPSVCTWDMDWMKTQTDAVVIDEAEKELKRLQAANDSIYNSNPTLSTQWRNYANSMLQCANRLTENSGSGSTTISSATCHNPIRSFKTNWATLS